MKGIAAFLKSFDVADLLPSMGAFSAGLTVWMIIFVLIGPLLMLALGAMYYYKPPKEANYSWGFRTYFTMGSVEVWRYTQRLAGKVWMLLGGAMAVLALVVSVILCFIGTQAVAVGAVVTVSIELVLVVASWVGINMVVLKFYDKDGNRRHAAKFETNKFLKP